MTRSKILMLKYLISAIVILVFAEKSVSAQDYRIGITLSPSITWFGSNTGEVTNKGARPGIDLTVKLERNFSGNFAYTGGVSFTSSSGRLQSAAATGFLFPDRTVNVGPGEAIIYRIRYLSIPFGLVGRTNEHNQISYHGEIGIDPAVVVSGRADIPSLDIKNGRAMKELNRFNIGYHLNAGADYSVNDNVQLTIGLGFENYFFDVTRDRLDQVRDHIGQRFIRFIFGVSFLGNN